jgi:hypothetical protein
MSALDLNDNSDVGSESVMFLSLEELENVVRVESSSSKSERLMMKMFEWFLFSAIVEEMIGL